MRKSFHAAVPIAVLLLGTVAHAMEVPDAVRVPAGHALAMKAVGVGELTYECRAKPGDAAMFEWVFVGPQARLLDAAGGREVGRYYAGPTWEAADGSKVTGKQVAVAPAAPGSIPLQLVKAEPSTGTGAMAGVAYIQRVNTQGGVAPSQACAASSAGEKRQVAYQADYLFFR
jgi:hypothetical protein